MEGHGSVSQEAEVRGEGSHHKWRIETLLLAAEIRCRNHFSLRVQRNKGAIRCLNRSQEDCILVLPPQIVRATAPSNLA